MKQSVSIIVLLLLISTVTVSFFQIGLVKADPKTIVVPDDYPSIQEAIDEASEGDIVFISEGIYFENLLIEKSLTIVGENKFTSIIDGNKVGSIILIKHDRVTIANLTIQNGGPITNDSSYFDAHTGIHLLQVNKCNITNNVLMNNGYNLWLYGSSENSIAGNYMKTGNSGIRLDHSSNNNKVIENHIENITLMGLYGHMAFGIHLFRDSHENIVKYNNISSNMYGIYGYSCINNTILENNVINNIYSIDFYGYAENNIVYNNNFINNTKVGRSPHSQYSNAWDNGSQGNYWSNYTGTDDDGDGIGDTPFIIYEGNQDNYPIMKMISFYPPPKNGPSNPDPFSNLPSAIIEFITSKIGLLLLAITTVVVGLIVILVLVLNRKRKSLEVVK